jgi:hypothetical protein
LWLAGAGDEPFRLEVTVPHHRRVGRLTGVRVHRARRQLIAVGNPPRTSVEDAVLDVCDGVAEPAAVVDVVLRATQRRTTTAARLATSLERRARQRWRALLVSILRDVRDGVASPLEREYARRVERAHGLPAARRNRPDRSAGRRVYRDVRYLPFEVLAELDGRTYHPPELAHLDRRRDNAEVVAARPVLRFGWREVVGEPCRAAEQVSMVLQQHGWQGQAYPCGPECALSMNRGLPTPVCGAETPRRRPS